MIRQMTERYIMLNSPNFPPVFADKAVLLSILQEQDLRSGFTIDRNSTPQKIHVSMIADGIVAEDNSFTCEIIRMREGA